MRKLEQCKAEVLLRSESRIKERRKKRRRIMTWCVPLALCVTACLAALLPAMGDRPKSAGREWGCEAAPENSFVCTYREVVIQKLGDEADSRRVMSPGETTKIFEAVYMLDASIGTGHMQMETAGTENSGDTGDTVIGSIKGQTGYEITFFGVDGTQVCYVLEENTLYNVTWDLIIPLTPAQGDALRATLGIEE